MTLKELEKTIRNCTLCNLYKKRIYPVPGEGRKNAQIMFVGEGPGKEEDLLGRPFVGQAGKFLDELLTLINLKREEVFIGNLVKCRPPFNREPFPEEIKSCFPYLVKQIKIIKPLLLILLGRHALNQFLPNLKISLVHGQAKRYLGIYSEKQVYLPLYHPAAALYNSSLKKILISDFRKIPPLLKKIKSYGD